MGISLTRRNAMKAGLGALSITKLGYLPNLKIDYRIEDAYAQEAEEKITLTDFSESMASTYKFFRDAFDPEENFKQNMKSLLKRALPVEIQEYSDDIIEGGIKGKAIETTVSLFAEKYGLGAVYSEVSEFFDAFNKLSDYDRINQLNKMNDEYLYYDPYVQLLVENGYLTDNEHFVPQAIDPIIELLENEKSMHSAEELVPNYKNQMERANLLQNLLDCDNMIKASAEISFPVYKLTFLGFTIENPC